MKKKEEYCYFTEFINNSNYIVESAEILKETLENYDVKKLEENINRVHKLENEADLLDGTATETDGNVSREN